MKFLYSILILLFLTPLISAAQSNYKPGYVITSKGDTLRGFVDYKEWDTNPAAISFKAAINDNKAQRFTASDITFFNVTDLESYQRYAEPISTDPTELNHLSSGRDSSYKNDVVFFKVLQRGKNLALYSYTDGLKKRFYVGEKPDYTPTELVFRMYYNTDAASSSADKTITENTYLKQLFAIANRYNVLDEDLINTLQKSQYSEPDMLKIVSRINNISKNDFVKNSGQASFSLFAGAGVSITATTLSPSPYLSAGGTSYTSVLPMVSFGMNVFANPNTRKLVFRVELALSEIKYQSNYTNKVLPNVPISYSYNQLAIGIVPQIIYNFYNTENFKIYAGLGVAFSYYQSSNESFASTDGKTPVSQIIQSNPNLFYTYNPAVIFKAGVQFSKNWGIFADYMTPAQVSHDPYFLMNFSTMQVVVNYFFK